MQNISSHTRQTGCLLTNYNIQDCLYVLTTTERHSVGCVYQTHLKYWLLLIGKETVQQISDLGVGEKIFYRLRDCNHDVASGFLGGAGGERECEVKHTLHVSDGDAVFPFDLKHMREQVLQVVRHVGWCVELPYLDLLVQPFHCRCVEGDCPSGKSVQQHTRRPDVCRRPQLDGKKGRIDKFSRGLVTKNVILWSTEIRGIQAYFQRG